MKTIQSMLIITIALAITISTADLSAAKYGNVTIEESMVPGGYEVRINTRDDLVLISHNSLQGRLKFEVDNYSSLKRIYHKINNIPFIESVTIEQFSENFAIIELIMNSDIPYEYSPVIGEKSLKIKFWGELLTSIADDYYELGEKHRLAGNNPAALESYRIAIRLTDGNHPPAYFGIGLIRKDVNQNKLAIGSFKNTLIDEELKREAHLHLSHLFERIGKEELSRKHRQLSEENGVDSANYLNMFLAAIPDVDSFDAALEGPEPNMQHSKIFLGSAKIVMLVVILLSPFAILLFAVWNSAKRSKNRNKKESFKEELEETLKSNNLSLAKAGNKIISTDSVKDTMRADRSLFEKESDGQINVSITNGIMNKRNRVTKIHKLIEQNYTTKQIAQDLYMSESEVNIILGIDSTVLNHIEYRNSSLGRISESPLKSKELSKELHRDEEELKLELLVHEHLNG